MIKTFADKQTTTIFEGLQVKKLPKDIQNTARRKLKQIDAAASIESLRVPPGNRLELLKGNRAGQWSIRINDQWHICFRWADGDSTDVEIADDHQERIMAITREQLKDMDFRDVTTGRHLAPVHPGNVLMKDFIEPLGITRYRVAKLAGVQQRRIDEICTGQRSITGDTALRLARLFSVDAAFWINLQAQYDLEVSYLEMHKRIEAEVTPLAMAA